MRAFHNAMLWWGDAWSCSQSCLVKEKCGWGMWREETKVTMGKGEKWGEEGSKALLPFKLVSQSVTLTITIRAARNESPMLQLMHNK